MAINFPASPTTNQLYTYNGNVYKWDGSKWRKASGLSTPIITEYTNSVTQTSSAISIDPAKYNYHKVTVDNDPTITIPNANPHASFVLELNYTAGASGYDIANASYDNTSFTFSGFPYSYASGIDFKPDGTKMYMVINTNNYTYTKVYQYSLSTAWDVSSASYDSVSSPSYTPTGYQQLEFKPDGTKAYFQTATNISQFTLSTAWDLSTFSYESFFSFSGQSSAIYGVTFSEDGTKMYAASVYPANIYQYTLSTAWDVSTASYDSISLSVSSQADPRGIAFNEDGTKMFTVGTSADAVYQYTLSTAWDLSTASYDSISFGIGSQDGVMYTLYFKPDGDKMYLFGNTSKTVYQYSTGSSSARTVTWSSNIQWASGTAPTIDYTYSSNIIIHFYTSDGVNWIGSPLSLDSRSS